MGFDGVQVLVFGKIIGFLTEKLIENPVGVNIFIKYIEKVQRLM